MNLIIKYSIIEEFWEIRSLYCNPSDYKGLRSVILPSFKSITSFYLNRQSAIKRIEKLWFPVQSHVEKAFKELGLIDLKTIPCFVHGISCEGFFHPNDNSIHVRCTDKDSDDKELLNTIIHEIVHLATYDKKYTYEEREKIVEEYLAKPEFKKILENY